MHKAFVVGSLLLLPFSASAEVIITEIMYDLPGTDTGREWIEVRNDGAADVDLSAYKLFEANTNHKLTVVQGSATVGGGAYAVIADNTEKFLIDNPGFSGILFDSAFSLANTTETLVLKNGDAEEDGVTYASETGAAGDGQTLQLMGTNWETGNPTPGSENVASASPSPEEEILEKTSTPEPDPQEETVATLPPPLEPTDDLGIPLTMTVKAGGDRTMTVGAAEFFKAQAYKKSGPPEKNAKYKWNFGNGSMRHDQEVLFQYNYPGRYAVRVTVEGPNDSKAFARFTVTAEPARIAVVNADSSGITIQNNDKRELNLSLWSLRSGSDYFLLPEDTIILPGAAVLFPAEVTGLAGGSAAALVYPNGKDAAVYALSDISAVAALPVAAVFSSVRAVPSVAAARTSEVPKVITADVMLSQEASILPAVSRTAARDPIPWFLGLTTILMLGLTALFIIRNKAQEGLQAEGYTIIDASFEDTNTQPLALGAGKSEKRSE